MVAILGSTFDGSYEPVAEIAAALDKLLADGGPDIPVHVDGASGGMIAPFLDPDLSWDFRLTRVVVDQHLRATSTAWSTRVSAGCCGGTRPICPTNWSST